MLKLLILEIEYLLENEMCICKIGFWNLTNVWVVEFYQKGKQDVQWAPCIVTVSSSSVLIPVICESY